MASVCFSQDSAKIYFPQLDYSSLKRDNLQFRKFPVNSRLPPLLPLIPLISGSVLHSSGPAGPHVDL